MKLYKAVTTDGKDFYSGRIDYASKLGTKDPVKHPKPARGSENASDYISVSVSSGDCTGFSWPARLLEVTPVGKEWTPHESARPNKRAAVAVRVVAELPAYLLFGPQGEACVAILDKFELLSSSDRTRLHQLRDDAWWSAWSVVYSGRADRAGLVAAQGALLDRLFGGWLDGGCTTYGAALAVLLRHTIGKDGFTQEHYNALVKPWVTVTGQKAHPEDVVF